MNLNQTIIIECEHQRLLLNRIAKHECGNCSRGHACTSCPWLPIIEKAESVIFEYQRVYIENQD